VIAKEELKFTIIMVLAMITWGYSWAGAKILGPYGDVSAKIFLRFFLASIALIPILLKYRIPFTVSKSGLQFILINAISLCSYNYFYFRSTHMGLAGVGGVLVTTLNPILTSTVVFCFVDKSVRFKDLIGLAIGFIGGSIIIRFWEMDLNLMIQSGSLFYILASFSWVSVTLSSQKSKNHIHFLSYSFWSFVVAASFSFLFCNLSDIAITINYDRYFWINILSLSIIVMSFANTMYFFASSKIGAVKASSFIFIVPLTAIIFSKILLDEPIRLTTLMGGSLSIIAIYLINKKN
tara:strand:- start:446 stop:1324 length:879 start_codon:yes stop_codon:yes gene_type:complete